MPNANYNRGVRWEREIMVAYTERGYTCLRSAGSHSAFDVIAIKPDLPVMLIQAKCHKKGTRTWAMNLCKTFIKNPPLPPSEHYTQAIEVFAMKDHHHAAGLI